MSSVFQALKRAKGLGSGHNGTHHFMTQRTSAIILIPLVLYFLYAVIELTEAKQFSDVVAWFGNPVNSALAVVFFLTGFYHAALGIQVIIEDYVHHEPTKWLALIATKGVCMIFAVIAVISILRIALIYWSAYWLTI